MRRLTLIAAIAVLAFAGCGGDDEEPASSGSSDSTSTPAAASGGGGETLKLTADPGGALKFDKTELTAKAGKVTIDLDNPSDVPHAIEIEGNGVEEEGKTVGKGAKSTATADLKAGTYDFYCPVGNHRAAGMEGKLTVE
jgi:plastocyanin